MRVQRNRRSRSAVAAPFTLSRSQQRCAAPHPAQRRAEVLASFGRYFGVAATRPAGYVEHDWTADPWTRGCYGAHFAPGVWTSYGEAWRAPAGRIHWAGAECAPQWNGYMEGAVRSGEAAAAAGRGRHPRQVSQKIVSPGAGRKSICFSALQH